jgi:DNA-binding GntR family transcriptional regulator
MMADIAKIQTLDLLPRTETLSRRAYGAVRKAIRDRIILPEVLYSEVQIADVLGISRTPVREALIELAREGIVDKFPQRGFRLRSISDEEAREVFEVRALLESHLARKLAIRASDQDVRTLGQILDRQARVTNDPSAFLELDEEFHLAFASLLGFARTRQMLLSLRGIIWVAGLAAIAQPRRAVKVLAEHRALLDRIAAGDPSGATKAIQSHIKNTAEASRTEQHFPQLPQSKPRTLLDVGRQRRTLPGERRRPKLNSSRVDPTIRG